MGAAVIYYSGDAAAAQIYKAHLISADLSNVRILDGRRYRDEDIEDCNEVHLMGDFPNIRKAYKEFAPDVKIIQVDADAVPDAPKDGAPGTDGAGSGQGSDGGSDSEEDGKAELEKLEAMTEEEVNALDPQAKGARTRRINALKAELAAA